MGRDNSTPDDEYSPPPPRKLTFTYELKIPRVSPTTIRYAWTNNTLRSLLTTILFLTGLSLALITLTTKTTSTYIQWSAIGLSLLSTTYIALSYWAIFEKYKRMLTTLFIISVYLLLQSVTNNVTTLRTILFLLTVTFFFFTYYIEKTKTVGKTLTVPDNFQT